LPSGTKSRNSGSVVIKTSTLFQTSSLVSMK